MSITGQERNGSPRIRRDMIALTKYSLTPEDQHIFELWTERRTQDSYHFADVHALIRSSAALRAFGSIAECVRVMERARRSIEVRS